MSQSTLTDSETTSPQGEADTSVVLVGNPNVGKTTLFNKLTGLRLKTANFPGTTLDIREGRITLDGVSHELIDMPGLYSLDSATAEERIAVNAILNPDTSVHKASLIILILDATNLIRNLFFASQILELGIPTVIALNMIDLSQKAGIQIDLEALEKHVGVPIAPIIARTGKGLNALQQRAAEELDRKVAPSRPMLLANIPDPDHANRYDWAETVFESCVVRKGGEGGAKTELADRVLTHPIGGVAIFVGVLFAVFYLIFSFASIPMDFIDGIVGGFGGWVRTYLPGGLVQDLIVDGIIAGVGGVLVFLPQIAILFFCLSILEDTGYLARAACVMDVHLRRVGLPGKAFVPILSAHACAIPGIMAARIIEDRRDRLAAILVLPLLSCSARLPVYAMVTALLFPDSAIKGAAIFTGAYILGIVAAMTMAFVFRRTLLKGPMQPLMIELPNYKVPSIRTALMAAYDRARVFVRKAGTVILAISVVLWWLMTFPQPPEIVSTDTTEVQVVQDSISYSFAGRLGRVIEPAIAPLGYDWRIGVGIISSFAAREVVVSSFSVIFGVEETEDEGGSSVLLEKLRVAKRDDGSKLFTFATSVSLLIFYVLAMQCLPTQAVTRRETGGWKWAAFQLGYMSALAYTASLISYQVLNGLGLG